jgi:hypothetical protein
MQLCMARIAAAYRQMSRAPKIGTREGNLSSHNSVSNPHKLLNHNDLLEVNSWQRRYTQPAILKTLEENRKLQAWLTTATPAAFVLNPLYQRILAVNHLNRRIYS